MKKYNVGILGCASIAKRFMIPAMKKAASIRDIYIASRNREVALNIASQFGINEERTYQSLIDNHDIDIIYIPLPTGLHKEWIAKALNMNKHVISEKSLTESFTDTLSVVNLAREKGLLVIENFMFTHHSQHAHIKDLIDAGEIGEIRSFRSSFGFPPFKDDENIRYNKELGGGALLDAGGYTVKAAQLILGLDLEVLGSHLYMDSIRGIDLWGSTFLKSKSKDVSAQLSFGFDHFYQCNYEVWGTIGKIIVHRSFTAGPDIMPQITIEKQNLRVDKILSSDNHFIKILDNFTELIANKHFYASKYDELLNQSRLLTEIKNHAQ